MAKMGFVKNIFDLFSDRADEEETVDDATNSDDYVDKKTAKGIFDEEETETPSTAGDIKYSPTGALEFSGLNSSSVQNFSAGAQGSKPSASQFTSAPKSSATTPNLYDIKAASKSPKFKLSFISLQDIYDAKNVAHLMMQKDTIIVVNISYLDDELKRRAMDFLDGAKYVSKTVFARFSETMCAFIPADIELSGDFYGQVEIATFDDRNF